MAEKQTSAASNTLMAFVLGAVVVVLAVFGYLALGGDVPGDGTDVNVKIDTPETSTDKKPDAGSPDQKQ
jgi:hypothetical protein